MKPVTEDVGFMNTFYEHAMHVPTGTTAAPIGELIVYIVIQQCILYVV